MFDARFIPSQYWWRALRFHSLIYDRNEETKIARIARVGRNDAAASVLRDVGRSVEYERICEHRQRVTYGNVIKVTRNFIGIRAYHNNGKDPGRR